VALVVGRGLAAAGSPGAAAYAPLIPLLAAMVWWPLSRRFAMCLAAALVTVHLIDRPDYRDLVIDRNFFGVVKVRVTPDEKYHLLMHGNILHGMQPRMADGRERPVSYYGHAGPIGQIFGTLGTPARPRVGVVGLGIGTLIAYGRPRDRWTFFEINPDVVRLARDPRYFTYLAEARAPYDIVMGEGRLNLARRRDAEFDVLVLDAFTSDAIPTHLITREAVQLYLEKLKPGGILLVNISNKYVSLAPVLGAITRDLALAGRWRSYVPTPAEADAGEFPASWVVIGRTAAALGPIARDPRWEPLPTEQDVPAWTDSYSSILSVMKWTS
jgi:SAM-dependent methyltransferase